jgi:predicted RNA binding protein YcfA (HicA-like mRNA interferase family)
MKSIKFKDLNKQLLSIGAAEHRKGKGSHLIYILDGQIISVPKHKVMSPGTLRDIRKRVNASREEQGLKPVEIGA